MSDNMYFKANTTISMDDLPEHVKKELYEKIELVNVSKEIDIINELLNFRKEEEVGDNYNVKKISFIFEELKHIEDKLTAQLETCQDLMNLLESYAEYTQKENDHDSTQVPNQEQKRTVSGEDQVRSAEEHSVS